MLPIRSRIRRNQSFGIHVPNVIVICAGGGGIPVVRRPDGSLIGVRAVIDRDRTASLLAQEIGAEALLLLTDVDAVYLDWGKPGQRALRRVTPQSGALRDIGNTMLWPTVVLLVARRLGKKTPSPEAELQTSIAHAS